MNRGKRGTGSAGQITGVCHRCGWRGPVTTVSARNRDDLGTGRVYGRLCEECMTTLVALRQAQRAARREASARREPSLARLGPGGPAPGQVGGADQTCTLETCIVDGDEVVES